MPFDGSNIDVANGFGFGSQSPNDLFAATWIAMLNYKDAKIWKALQDNGMSIDFSWERSARQYEQVYQHAMFA